MPDPDAAIAVETIAAAPDTLRSLPDSWRWTRLGDVCEVTHGGTPSKANAAYWNGHIPWISPKDMKSATLSDSADHITQLAEDEKAAPIIDPGSILVVVRSGILAHTVPVALLMVRAAINQDIKALSPDTDSVVPEYLLWSLRSLSPNILASGVKKGPTVHSIVSGYIEALPIPLPPLAEQRRIAAILAERMAAVERARAAAEAQLAAAQALPAAELRAVLESDEAQKWPIAAIGEVARVQSGYAFKSDWFSDEGVRLLRNINVHQGYVDWTDMVRLPFARRLNFAAYELYEGDIVLSLDRPVVAGGLKLTRLSADDVPALLLQRVGRFVLKDAIDSGYLYAFLSSPDFIHAITQHDHSLGVPHVSPGQVEGVTLPLPPLAEQRRIAAHLDARMAEIARLRETLEAQRDAVNALPAALLRQAFNGEM